MLKIEDLRAFSHVYDHPTDHSCRRVALYSANGVQRLIDERDAKVTELAATVAELEDDNFSLSAGMCCEANGLSADEGGVIYCKPAQRVAELNAKWLKEQAINLENEADYEAQDTEISAMRARVKELEAKVEDWTRRSESCESKLGQLEANERVIELEAKVAELQE